MSWKEAIKGVAVTVLVIALIVGIVTLLVVSLGVLWGPIACFIVGIIAFTIYLKIWG